jgi:hypothetical protein
MLLAPVQQILRQVPAVQGYAAPLLDSVFFMPVAVSVLGMFLFNLVLPAEVRVLVMLVEL